MVEHQDAAVEPILVQEAAGRNRLEPCLIHGRLGVRAVGECLESHPGVHVAAVVDDQDRLLGVVPLRLILDDLCVRVAPEEFVADLGDPDGLAEFGRITRAHTAADLMEEPAFVTMDDSVREAFARMRERKLEGLPIVDSTMKVVGYLDRVQILGVWLRPVAE